MTPVVRVGVVQMNSVPDVQENMSRAETAVRGAAQDGAKLVVLPECCLYFGPEDGKMAIAEPIAQRGGPLLQRCVAWASQFEVELVVGGFWEKPQANPSGAHVYNACFVISSRGEVLRPVYRKIHLFDVDLPDGTQLRESNRVLPGNEKVVVDTVAGRLGLSVCYDVRFPELYRALVTAGAELLAVPAAFTETTGKDHWHVLLRARAIENQCYVLAAAQVGHHFGKRRSFGHAMIVDPWGQVVAEAEEDDTHVCANVDLGELHQLRARLPALRHRRQEQQV